ncbi:50S ribosomal protein L9 [Thermasporomyces composti]|jgi:large subunit ribosomal protein L9|uniref:Large ribosomal subunit protein bL9 n=1 Tax=Thermasporomyces composti TaxID=696763 RepID=A0A3D9VE84_THECX|nr:50S ribosomal protein L9 [Thermasporomyces composti]REF36454.1 large subunit ribosomal protein L9 [Thermasporomyces composti]
MKLILTQEVSGLGGPGDIVEVKDGYGRNYLMPRGLAIRWTKGGEKQVAAIRKAREVRQIRDLDQAREVKAQLEGLTITVPARSGASGRLFGSVTPADIVEAVKQAGGPQIDKRRIEIANPIKTLGSHQVSVRLHPELSATLALEVVPAA